MARLGSRRRAATLQDRRQREQQTYVERILLLLIIKFSKVSSSKVSSLSLVQVLLCLVPPQAQSRPSWHFRTNARRIRASPRGPTSSLTKTLTHIALTYRSTALRQGWYTLSKGVIWHIRCSVVLVYSSYYVTQGSRWPGSAASRRRRP